MKALGIDQFHKKKYKWLGFEGVWLKFMGKLTMFFVGIVFGLSGSGKTEFCIRLAKYLCKFGKVAWLSYEQGHDEDFQTATIRNRMEEQKGIFITIDPLDKRNTKLTLFQELDEYLGKRSTPPFVFIDSLDYLQLTLDEYFYLKEKYGRKKGIIFLAHEKNGLPESKLAQKVMYDGKFAVRVYKRTARAVKNRLGGTGNFCVWFKESRRLDPMFWKKVEAGIEIIHNHEDEKIEQEMELETKEEVAHA